MAYGDDPIVGTVQAPTPAAGRYGQDPVVGQRQAGPNDGIPTMVIRPRTGQAPAPPPMSAGEAFGTGLMDPVQGGAQLLSHMVPKAVSDRIDSANNWLADKTGLVARLPPGGMDEATRRREADIEARSPSTVRGIETRLDEKGRASHTPVTRQVGPDPYRTLGGMANPMNYLAPETGNPLLTGMLAGGVAGALSPAAGDGFWKEKALQTGAGGVVGGVFGGAPAAARALGAPKPPTPAMTQLVARIPGLNPETSKAVRAISDRFLQGQRGGGPTAADILDQLGANPGKPLTLMDLGGTEGRALGGRMFRGPDSGRTVIETALRGRDAAAGERLTGDVNRAFSGTTAFDAKLQLDKTRKTAASPLYESAFSRIQVTPEEAAHVERFIHDPIGQDALNQGMRVIQLEHLAEGATFDPAVYGVVRGDDGRWVLQGDARNLRLMDAVKRGYDEIVEGFRNPTTGRLDLNQYGRAVNQVRAAYVGDLRAMFPRYGNALDAWGGPSASMDAVDFGRNALSQDPQAIAARLQGMTEGDREYARLGIAQQLREQIDRTGVSGDEAKRVLHDTAMRKRLRPFFKTQGEYDRFIRSVETEQRMFETNYQVMGNSPTAGRRAEDASPLDPKDMAHTAVAGAMGHGATVLNGLLSSIFKLWGRENPQLNEEIARIMSSNLNEQDIAARLIQLRNFPNLGREPAPPRPGPRPLTGIDTFAAPMVAAGLRPEMASPLQQLGGQPR